MQKLATIFFVIMLWPVLLIGQERQAKLLDYAIDLVNKAEYTVAMQTLDKLLQTNANHPDALFLRGYCCYKENKDEQALPDLDKAISLDPAYANAYLIRARVHRSMGHYWLALKDFNRARKLDPYLTFFSVSKEMLTD